jgi:hypothetical protein
MSDLQTWDKPLPEPIRILQDLLEAAGTSFIRATFDYSFFIDPEAVRAKCPYYPDRARLSREHYPGLQRGAYAECHGRRVRLGDNSRAQMAWSGYTKRSIARSSGYSVRHIWGRPWDPDAFTAGWNLCYMPFWLGMLTEEQLPHERIQKAIQQVSFNLYFRLGHIGPVPSYVSDPGLDLDQLLSGQKIQILGRDRTESILSPAAGETAPSERIKVIRRLSSQSWSNLLKAAQTLRGLPHEPYGTTKVESSSKSVIRRMLRETSLDLDELTRLLQELKGEG